jgi:hypothetical protein
MEKRESNPDKGQQQGDEKNKQRDIGHAHDQDRRKEEEKRHAPGRSQDPDRSRGEGDKKQTHQGK